MYSRDTEIRRISSSDVYKLAQILEPTNAWKKLMQLIPRDPFVISSGDISSSVFKYGNDHIRLVEKASLNQNRMSAEVLFEEWGTSGKRRPNVGVLLELLVKAELFRAADFVAINFLNEPPPERPLKGPAAKIDISIPMDSEDIRNVEEMISTGSYPGTDTLNDNAINSSTMNNNKNYFEKHAQSEKNINISATDLITFPSTTANTASTVDIEDVPRLSALLPPRPDIYDDTTNQSEPEHDSGHHDSINSSLFNGTLSSPGFNCEIPNLSEFIEAAKTEELPNFSDMIIPDTTLLPDVTALHYRDDDEHSNLPEQQSPNHSNSSSSLSSHNSIPNLSIFDQRSSNNDSSLTNITETSGENSFDMSNGSFVSNDNIPCLSLLK